MPRDRVAVANAGGAVGSIITQLAKKAGCHVVGFAGGSARCQQLLELLGIDRCLDYRANDFAQQLKLAFPEGIDVFTDGVGGGLTEIVAQQMNRNGRLLAYGNSSEAYAEEVKSGLGWNLNALRQIFVGTTADAIAVEKNIKVEAWVVHDFYYARLAAEDELSRLLLSDAIKAVSTVIEGFEALPSAVSSLYRHQPHLGKLQVRFAE
jgi:hypothetical protein